MSSIGYTVAQQRDLRLNLQRRLQSAGLFEATPLYYTIRWRVLNMLTVVGVVALIFVDSVEFVLLMAAYFTVVDTQLSYIAHDAGHKQVYPGNPAANMRIMLWLCLRLALSGSWWMSAHDAHHFWPNDIEKDPNLGVPILSFHPSQMLQKHPILRIICKFQFLYYFVVVMFETMLMRITSVQFLLTMRKSEKANDVRLADLQLLLMFVYAVVYVGGLVLLLGWMAPVFIVAHQLGLGLHLGVAFAPNHKGMEVVDDSSTRGFFDQQLLTTRNVKPGRILDIFLGGLNYQTEHHFFRNIPRGNLAKARKIVKAFCEEFGLPYVEKSLFWSIWDIEKYWVWASWTSWTPAMEAAA